MAQVESVVAELRELLGNEHVITDRSVLSEYETATFLTNQRIPLVVLPSSTDEVVAIVRIANKYRMPIYPISRGRNWGMGSRLPVNSNNCVVDLRRMNRIVEFNEQLSYITVEPGVTFRQVAEYLEKENSNLYLSAIGGPPDSSLVANALERGDGLGPLGDRARYCCALEAVLPTGVRIDTGFDAFKNSLTGKLSQFGLGPSIESLFFQSNLAIITKMTVWLARRPSHFQCVLFAVNTERELVELTSTMRELQQYGVFGCTSLMIWNIYRYLVTQMQYPWGENGKARNSPDELLMYLPRQWRDVKWVGIAGLYAISGAHARSGKKILKKALKGKVSKLLIIDSLVAKFARFFKAPLGRVAGIDFEKILNTFYFESAYLGYPTKVELSSIYWRKKTPIPPDPDPDRDRCGLHWICISLPFDGEHISRTTHIVERISFEYNLEPQVMFFNMSERLMKSFIPIIFDRDEAGDEKRARSCYHAVFSELAQAGYTPARVGIQSMEAVAPCQQEYTDVLQQLKKVFDPNDILAPGRYDFRHCWNKEL